MALLVIFTSCKKESTENPGNGSGEPNTVVGTVVNAQGQPMAGVKVRAENPTGYNIYVDGTTDAAGKYKLKINGIGGWKVYAWKEVEYGGKLYNLRLGMKNAADYDAFSTEDKTVVKDFVWKLDGRIPDRPASADYGMGYFGASLYFVNLNDALKMPAGTKVTVTLTPEEGATYLDGTPATTTVTKSFTIGNNGDNYYIGDIKVSSYTMRLQSELNGVTKTVRVGVNSVLGNYFESISELYWDPHTLSTGSYESGIKTGTSISFYMKQQ
ncbi:carboxypeptidase regulatory-like domain-containing protein [Flavisolibacter sp. BT320]|nr:carboxypeptidase regulatory-like domain-containing protein [Flavisolibacter longurius]